MHMWKVRVYQIYFKMYRSSHAICHSQNPCRRHCVMAAIFEWKMGELEGVLKFTMDYDNWTPGQVNMIKWW